MTRVVCDFLHDASSARSRNRMRQSQAKVVPSKSAFTNHSEPLGLVFDMPLCMLALWHLLRFIGSD